MALKDEKKLVVGRMAAPLNWISAAPITASCMHHNMIEFTTEEPGRNALNLHSNASYSTDQGPMYAVHLMVGAQTMLLCRLKIL